MIERALDIIDGADILAAEDQEALAGLAGELRHTWETAQIFRTRTEMLVSVLGDAKRPTPDSKYWQAVREQDVMLRELVLLSYEYRKNAVEIRKLRRDLQACTGALDAELVQIEIEKKTFLAHDMERTARDRLREIREWSRIKAELRPHMKFGEEDVNAHQLEAMRQRYAFEASLVTPATQPADARNILGLRHMAERVRPDEAAPGLTGETGRGEGHGDALLPD
jgi:hypothetical protein